MADETIDLGIDGIGPAALVGRGGSAFVYVAEQVGFGRKVAVKILFEALEDDATYKRFDRECRAIGAVSDHPNIVVVHGRGLTADDRPYLVMEHRSGGSLAESLAVRGRLPEAEAIRIGIKIGDALHVAHTTGVLHRDVKPANILLSAYNEPALADFGIARMEGSHKTTEGLFSASVIHASREILDTGDPTPSSDVYALGSTLFELVTGAPAFGNPDDASMWAIINRVLSEDVPDPRLHGVSDGLAAVISKAMSHDQTARHQTAAAFVADLEGLLSGRGVAQATTAPIPETSSAASADQPTDVVPIQQPNQQATAAPTETASRRTAAIAFAAIVVVTAAAGAVALATGLVTPDRTGGVVDASTTPRASLAPTDEGSTDGSDTGSPEDNGAESTDLSAETPTLNGPQLVFPRAEIGPLEEGSRYALAVDRAIDSAGYRIVVDGKKVTEYQPTIPVYFPEPGRHQLQLQVSGDEVVYLTEPVEIYVSTDPRPGFRANLSAIRSRPENWPEALRQFDQLVLDGHTDLKLTLSTRDDPDDDFPHWLYYVDGFGDDKEEALAYCDSFELGPEACFVAEV